MRRLFLILSLVMTAGCSARDQVRVVVENPDTPQMQVAVPRLGAQGSVTPVGRNGEVETWRTPDFVTFSFDRGVLVATRGLGDDLMSADLAQTHAALDGDADHWGPRIHSYLDGEYKSYFMAFQCRRTDSGAETITIGNTARRTTHIEEHCVTEGREIVNHYWRGADGVMWKSRQWVSPSAGYLETERRVR